MSDLSTYMEDKIVNFMRNVPVTGETAVYVALFGADDGLENGSITSEIDTTCGYARQPAGLTAPADGESTNAEDIVFPVATCGWSTVRYVALMDAPTEGNVIMHHILDAEKTVSAGDTFKILAGELHAILR